MKLPQLLTKEFILSQVSEEEIFERYGVKVRKGTFKAPAILRPDDKHASCNFFRHKTNNKLILKDYGGFSGDCFDLVMYTQGGNFNAALRIIANDFGLIPGQITRTKREPDIKIETKESSEIRVKRRPFNKFDLEYWGAYRQSKSDLEFARISACERVWVNGNQIYYYTNVNDPAYVYHFGEYNYKIYFPFREINRFLHTDSEILQGELLLPQQGDTLIYTKSYKDVICLRKFGLYAVSPMAESICPRPDKVQKLNNRFKQSLTLMDYDNAGIHLAWTMRRLYGFPALFFTDKVWNRKKGYLGAKDFSDYVKLYGERQTNLLIEKITKLCQI